MGLFQDIAANELGQTFAEETNQYVIVDVRTEEEYNEGHIPGSINIPVDELENRIHELKPVKGKPLLLVCRSGSRSMFAGMILADKGFANLYNLSGGMMAWTGPLTRPIIS